MSSQTLTLAAPVGVVLLWIGLEVWNRAATDRLDRLKPEIAEAIQVYLDRHTARGEVPPAFYWDFGQGRVVEFAPGVAEQVRSGGTDPDAPFAVETVVEAGASSPWLPVWMWGLWGGSYIVRIPLALTTVGLLGLWLRLRTGAA